MLLNLKCETAVIVFSVCWEEQEYYRSQMVSKQVLVSMLSNKAYIFYIMFSRDHYTLVGV